MNRNIGVIAHRAFRVWLRPDGIVQLVWTPRTTPRPADAVAALKAVAQVTEGRPSPMLVDMHDLGPLDRPTRAELTRPRGPQTAIGLIVGTPLSRMMGNLALSTSKPGPPVRSFNNEPSAVAWLKKFVVADGIARAAS